jgi:hypothetical protein
LFRPLPGLPVIVAFAALDAFKESPCRAESVGKAGKPA